nr:VPLPA-CTERM sorting domain-containing protein [uncultured Roseovarius sp.]
MKTLLLAAAFGMVSTAALAATYTYDYSASFTSKLYDAPDRDSLTDTIQAMGTITGQIIFDDTVLRVDSPRIIRYAAPIVTIDGIDMSLFERLPSSLLVRNNTGNADTVTTSHLGYGSGTVNGGKDTLNITFSDFTQTVLSDASLPTRFNLGDWNSSYSYLSLNSFVYTYGAPGSSFSERDRVTFQFDSLTPVTPVPLPAGIWLLSAGLAGLGMVRRRKRG